jgi:nitroimidazol reductase NimA-like FMN-containing flavoprotein (pyridoxamine 5'-phosphate oxidase superfamily)
VKIQDISEGECLKILKHSRLARLACAKDNQPYVVPIYVAYDAGVLYGFATPGMRLDWMRKNPLVCVEVEEIHSPQQWTSVVVFGRFDELPMPEQAWDSQQRRPQPPGQQPEHPIIDDYQRAHNVLEERHPEWFEPGLASAEHHDPKQPVAPIYYRISVDEITGRRAMP